MTAEQPTKELLDEPGTTPNLGGRAIAYVGCRRSLVQHYRSLVEQLNGRFIHHDGGVEDNRSALEC